MNPPGKTSAHSDQSLCCYVSYELEVSISSMNWDWVPQPLKLKQQYPFERNWRIYAGHPQEKTASWTNSNWFLLRSLFINPFSGCSGHRAWDQFCSAERFWEAICVAGHQASKVSNGARLSQCITMERIFKSGLSLQLSNLESPRPQIPGGLWQGWTHIMKKTLAL